MNCIKITRITAIVCFLSLTVTSCTKEGDVGPQGPQGNANVKSVSFNVAANDWQYQTGNASFNRTTTEISTAIYDRGSVDVYWQINGNWVALPFSYPKDSLTQSMGFGYNVGVLNVFVTNSDGSTPSQLGTATFKAVITAGP